MGVGWGPGGEGGGGGGGVETAQQPSMHVTLLVAEAKMR